MNLDAKALSGFIKEIEDSRDRAKAETDFQRDVFRRAREKHFDVKAMRIVLQRRAMDASARDEQDYNVHAYESALGAKKLAVEAMEQGVSAREAARAHGLPRAAVAALKPAAETGAENEIFEPNHEVERAEAGPIAEAPTDGQGGATGPLDTDDLAIPPALRRVRG